jgi:DNA-directed RNA polymerase subunit RPC12/RpoP
MTQTRNPIACPQCGETERIAFVQVHRIARRYATPALIEDDDETYLGVDSDPDEEIIDSMGNDEYMECSACSHRWSTPEVDDIVYEP